MLLKRIIYSMSTLCYQQRKEDGENLNKEGI